MILNDCQKCTSCNRAEVILSLCEKCQAGCIDLTHKETQCCKGCRQCIRCGEWVHFNNTSTQYVFSEDICLECSLEEERRLQAEASESLEVGHLYIHISTKNLYRITAFAKTKEDGKWVDGVIYQREVANDEGKGRLYFHTCRNFRQRFER